MVARSTHSRRMPVDASSSSMIRKYAREPFKTSAAPASNHSGENTRHHRAQLPTTLRAVFCAAIRPAVSPATAPDRVQLDRLEIACAARWSASAAVRGRRSRRRSMPQPCFRNRCARTNRGRNLSHSDVSGMLPQVRTIEGARRWRSWRLSASATRW